MMVIGIMVLLAGLAIPFYQSFQVSSGLDNATRELVSTLRRVQNLAMGSDQWSPWGVHIEAHRYVVFVGTSYNAADPHNESYSVSPTVTISSAAGTDIVFARITGTTSNVGTVTLQTTTNESTSVVITSLGTVYVQ